MDGAHVTNEDANPFRPVFRAGIGHDTHRLGESGPLRLGGIDIPHDKHAIGHSDADVLLHAVTDALLGAIAGGDFGEVFADSDPANLGRDSEDMLREACRRVRSAGYRIGNIDCIVFAERPKIGPFKQAIRERLAHILEIELDQVGLKAKTGEKVDAVGCQLAIQAQCVVMIIDQLSHPNLRA